LDFTVTSYRTAEYGERGYRKVSRADAEPSQKDAVFEILGRVKSVPEEWRLQAHAAEVPGRYRDTGQ
jgi:hypothetical protein